MASDLTCSLNDLLKRDDLRGQIDCNRYVTDTVGLPTLNDILEELNKPGRDPREQFETFSFTEGINTIQDLKPDMKLPGIVTNITAFGAFIDIGVHQDGLVHISQLADRYVKNPTDIVHVQQKVTVTVVEIDLRRNRIALSMRQKPAEKPTPKQSKRPQQTRPQKKENRKPQQKKSAVNTAFADALKKAGL
ncbi:MAG: S1 RNA-binding domain-containing protein, partial [Candidatus Latescibacteria bacterium]|jgi:uncharacterized protein|nr:S1 RNA-binding domain-containing protein [Candidatus Latescibacterota bacterium]